MLCQNGRGTVATGYASSGVSQPDGGRPPLTDDLGDRGQCFSCGFLGHGVKDDSLVAQASEQHIVCNTDPGKGPEISSVPAGDTLVTWTVYIWRR